ncbi:MAG: YhgE/Pip domain-containing protein [Clostridium sp.]|nr:YhgE/Pip domain-containing protein [Clostridium sp.]
MKKIFNIFIRDIKNIVSNPAAIFIAIGLCILPSLYAWINIQACWNPYANTGNIPVAIVNEDEGTQINGKSVNIGNQIVNELKKNKSINWVFVDSWQGNYGLNDGKYYSLIDIPTNFSSGLASLASSNPKKPDIIYKNNEKLNAIAAKITNVAKDNLAKQIKTQFVSTVNKETLGVIGSQAGNPEHAKAQIIQLKETLSETSDNLKSTQKYIGEANSSSQYLQQYLNKLKNTLPKITDEITSLQKASDANKDLINSTKQTVDSTSTQLNNDIVQMQSLNNQIQNLLNELRAINNGTSTGNSTDIANQMVNLSNSEINLLNSDIKDLQSINSIIQNSSITNVINSLNSIVSLVSSESNNLNQIKSLVASGSPKDSINSATNNASNLSSSIANSMSVASNSFYSTALPVFDTTSNNLASSITNTNAVLEATKVLVPQLNALVDYGISTSKLSTNQANDLNSKLNSLEDKLNILSDKMNSLSSEDIDQIIKIMKKNPNEVASFIASPLNIKQVDVYGEGVFGVGLTPFYTVLAIWVGALLCAALLTTKCKDFEDGQKLNLIQKHFGKMLLFLMFSFIQTIIVTAGDKFILGVNPQNTPLFFGFAIASSITFTIIIFTLVSIFGNVGKAIVVVMMVFQIAGAGGIYPIQTNPKIFGILEPLWPFTYSIDGFREAIGGPIWPNVYKNLTALGIFAIIFLCLVILKRPFHKLTSFMEHKFKESGI